MTNWGERQGPEDRVFVRTPEGEVEVKNLIAYLYGTDDPAAWPAWFQVGSRWVRQGDDGEPVWTDRNPWGSTGDGR